MFSHQSFSHFAFNMLGVLTFGINILPYIGSTGFLQLYMAGGLIGGLCYAGYPFMESKSIRRLYNSAFYTPGLGASGAVSALVIYSVMNNPTAIILVNLFIPVPAALFGVGFIVWDVVRLQTEGNTSGGSAHLGGAAAGALYFFFKRFHRRRFR